MRQCQETSQSSGYFTSLSHGKLSNLTSLSRGIIRRVMLVKRRKNFFDLLHFDLVVGGAIFGATDVVVTRSLPREQYLKVFLTIDDVSKYQNLE